MMHNPTLIRETQLRLYALYDKGKIKPVITDLFPIEEYEGAYAAMMERRAKGKVILTF